jgi:uncharacterized protein
VKRVQIGVISDTHGLVRPEAVSALMGSELIIHAGDIGEPAVLEALRKLAPVVAVRGNVDNEPWTGILPRVGTVEIEGASIYVLHNIQDLDLDPAAAGFQAVVCGHSHRPAIHTHAGVVYFNPGSAGPRRFNLHASVGLLYVTGGVIEPHVVSLDH